MRRKCLQAWTPSGALSRMYCLQLACRIAPSTIRHSSAQLCSGVPGSRATSDEVKDALAILWGYDPVHPSNVCYDALATGLANILEPVTADICSSSAADNIAIEQPAKRPRWMDLDAKNTVAPRGGSARGSWRGPRGPWRGSRGPWRGPQRGRGKRGY
jgi:hypothetical protein